LAEWFWYTDPAASILEQINKKQGQGRASRTTAIKDRGMEAGFSSRVFCVELKWIDFPLEQKVRSLQSDK